MDTSSGTTHARWLLSEENQAKVLSALKPGGVLWRALFEAWDLDKSQTLTSDEIAKGLDSVAHDVTLAAYARRILRRIHFSEAGTCSRAEFEDSAALVFNDLKDHTTTFDLT